MLGPLLPALIQHWHIQDAQAGTLFTASFAGQFCGAWFATRNLRASILYGSAITAAGCTAMAWVGFGPAHIALFCVGLGLGAGLTAGNVIAGTTVPTARARLIAILNVAWGLGAIACPVLVRLFSARRHPALLLCDRSLSRRHLARRHRHPAVPIRRTSRHKRLAVRIATHPPHITRMPLPPFPLFVFGAAIFLYIGVENSLGGWLPSYAVRTNPALHASSIAIYFWVAELTGRILVTALMTLLGEAALYRICLALLILTQILLCVIATHICHRHRHANGSRRTQPCSALSPHRVLPARPHRQPRTPRRALCHSLFWRSHPALAHRRLLHSIPRSSRRLPRPRRRSSPAPLPLPHPHRQTHLQQIAIWYGCPDEIRQ